MSETYREKVGKYTIRVVARGVPPVPNVVVERYGRPPVLLAYKDLVDLYEGKRTFAMYAGIPSRLQKKVMQVICSALGKPFNMEIYERVRTYRIIKPKYEIVSLTLDEILERLEDAGPEEREQYEELLDEAVEDLTERLRRARELLEKGGE